MAPLHRSKEQVRVELGSPCRLYNRQHPCAVTAADCSSSVCLGLFALGDSSVASIAFQNGPALFTLVLGEDVCRGILLPIAASWRDRAGGPRVELRQSADAQRQRRVHKRSPHVVHAEARGRFAI